MGVGVGQSTLLTFSVYVVVRYFILGLNFIFFCFWGMVMYDSEFFWKRKGNKMKTNDKIEPEHLYKTKPRFTTVLF